MTDGIPAKAIAFPGAKSDGDFNHLSKLAADHFKVAFDESEDDSKEGKTSKHSSRKKAVKRRREEAEVARREAQLADGTADENPVTAADFERLLAGDPNSSEIYIRFMAYYLSLSDIDSARNVAERAFNRIEFREEGEKLNVWSALLVLVSNRRFSVFAIIDMAKLMNN